MTLPRTQTSESAPSALLLHRIFETIGIDHQAAQAFLQLYPDGSHDLSALFISFSSDQTALQHHIRKELEAPNDFSFSPSDGLRLSLLHRWFLLQAPNQYPWRRLTPKFRDELHRHQFPTNTNCDDLPNNNVSFNNVYNYAKSSNNFNIEEENDTVDLSSNEDNDEWNCPMCFAPKVNEHTDLNGSSIGVLFPNKYINSSSNEDNVSDSPFDINNDFFYNVSSIDTSSHFVYDHATDHEIYIDDDSVRATHSDDHHDDSPSQWESHHDDASSFLEQIDDDMCHNLSDPPITTLDETHSLLLISPNKMSGALIFTDPNDSTCVNSLSLLDHTNFTHGHNNGNADNAPEFDRNKHTGNPTFCIESTVTSNHNTCDEAGCLDHESQTTTNHMSQDGTNICHAIPTMDDTINHAIPCYHVDFNIDTFIPCHAEDLPNTYSKLDQCGTNVKADTSSNNSFNICINNPHSDSKTSFLGFFEYIGLSQASIDFILTCLFPDGFDDLQVFFDLYADDETELGNLLSPLLGSSDTRKIIMLHRWYLQLSTTPLDCSTFITSLSLEFTYCNSPHLQSPINDDNCISCSHLPSDASSFATYWICNSDSAVFLGTVMLQQILNAATHTTITSFSYGQPKIALRHVLCSATVTDTAAVNSNICGAANCTMFFETTNLDTSTAVLTVSDPPSLSYACNQHLSQLTPSPDKEPRIFNTQFVTDWHQADNSCTDRAMIPQNTTSTAQSQAATITFTGHIGLSTISDTANDANHSGGTSSTPIIQFIGTTNMIPDRVFGNASASTFTNIGNIHLSLFYSNYSIQVNNSGYAATSSADYETIILLPGMAIKYCTKHRQHSSQPHIIQLEQQHVGFIPSNVNISNKASICNVLSSLEMAANHTAWHTNISSTFEWTLNRNTLTSKMMDFMIDNNFMHPVTIENGTNTAFNESFRRDANHYSTIIPDNPFVSPSNNENVQLSAFSAPYSSRESDSSYATASADHDWVVFLPGETIPLAHQQIGLITLSIDTSNQAPLCNVLSAVEMAANHTAWHTNIYFSFDWIPDRNNHILATMDSTFNNRDLIYHPAIAKDCTNITFDGCFHRDPTYHCTRVTNNHFVSPTFDSFGLHHETAQTINALESKMISVCATLPVQPCIPTSFGFIPHKSSFPPDNTTGTNTVIVPDNIFPTHHPNICNPTNFALRMDTTSHQLTTNSNNNELKNNIPFDSLGTTTEMIAPTCNSRPTFEFGLPLTILKGKLIPRVYNFMRHIFIDGKDGRATATTTAFARVHNILQQEMNAFLTIG